MSESNRQAHSQTHACGHEVSHDHRDEETGVALDPVCGMRVDPTATPHHAEHAGRPYHFCSAGCLTDFIEEATRLFGDALGHEREDVSDLVTLYALVAKMRLIAPSDVIERAEYVVDSIVSAYLGPNRTLHQLREFAKEGGMDPLRQFSAACRTELNRFGDA